MRGFLSTKYCKRRRIHRPNVSGSRMYTRAVLLNVTDIGLQVLDNVIMTKWKVLPKEQQQGERPDSLFWAFTFNKSY